MENFKPVKGRLEVLKLNDCEIYIGKSDNSDAIKPLLEEVDFTAIFVGTPRHNENHRFDILNEVVDANPEAIILAEHYGDPSSWLAGDQWDTVMNYSAFMEPVTWFLTGMEKHSDEKRPDLLANSQAFRDAMNYHMSKFQYPSLLTAMNELSNHDHSRFLTRTNMTVGRIASLGAEAADENVNLGRNAFRQHC